DGLFQKPECTQVMNRAYRSLNVSEGGGDDGWDLDALFPHALQESHPVHPWHHDIGDQDIGREPSEFVERFLAVARRFGAIAPCRDHRLQSAALIFLIVNDQDIGDWRL